MSSFTDFERSEARRAIESALRKSEKALLKLKQGTFSHTLTTRGIAAYQIALELLQAANEPDRSAERKPQEYSNEELTAAVRYFEDVIGRVEKILPKFPAGKSQFTLAVRRIMAFEIARALILEQIQNENPDCITTEKR